MNATENETFVPDITNSPPEPPPLSARAVWPKTPQERDIARELIKACYEAAHDEKGQISWVAPVNADRWAQLLHWAADKPIRVHQLALHMRSKRLIPGLVGSQINARGRITRGSSSRFAELDAWFEEHGDSIPANPSIKNSYAWEASKQTHPDMWLLAKAVWLGKDERVLTQNLSARYKRGGKRMVNQAKAEAKKESRYSSIRSNDSRNNDIPGTAELEEWLNANLPTVPRSKTGRIWWRQAIGEQPKLAKLLDARFGNKPLKDQLSALKFFIKRRHLDGKKPTRAVAHRTTLADRPRPEQSHENPAPAPAADLLNGKHPPQPPEFKFELCPICYFAVGIVEKMTGQPAITCPKCNFPLIKAAQGVVARLSMPD